MMRRLMTTGAQWAVTCLAISVLIAPVAIVLVLGRWVGRVAEAQAWHPVFAFGATWLVWPVLIVAVFRVWFGGLARAWFWCVGRIARRCARTVESGDVWVSCCGGACSAVPGAGDAEGEAEQLEVEKECGAVGAEA